MIAHCNFFYLKARSVRPIKIDKAEEFVDETKVKVRTKKLTQEEEMKKGKYFIKFVRL